VACSIDTPFSITASVHESTAEVTVVGEIDPATVGTFSTVLLTLVDDGVDHFVIDASGVTFVDSTAIHALQMLLNAGDGTRVTLSGATHRLVDLLLATGLDTMIAVDPAP
jgi:anti-sigma B factor antagonist